MSDELMPAPTPEEEITNLRERIEQLTRDLDAARKADPADVAELRKQLDAAQRELADLRRTPPPAPQPAPSKRLDGFYEVEEP